MRRYRKTSICFNIMESKIIYQIALSMAKGVGIHTIKKLCAAVGDESAIFQCSAKELEAIPGIGPATTQAILDPELIKSAEKELSTLERHGGRAIAQGDKAYPERLCECVDAPYVLYSKGKMEMNAPHVIGIVGTRKMTHYGKAICEEILSHLAEKHPDLLVVSGLAYGVDGCAHKKAVELGLSTIGVVGHGLDILYPVKHRTLAERMMQDGGIVTEYRTKCVVDRKNFVSRNRIIAGLCDVILVIESGEKGGALFTAEFANSYNRDICAIPGRIGDTYSAGCNKLIKTHMATMVESAEEIDKLMNWDVVSPAKQVMNISQFMELSERERIIVEALQLESTMDMNQLVRKTQISFKELSSLLFDMEMKELVRSAPGNRYSLSPFR